MPFNEEFSTQVLFVNFRMVNFVEIILILCTFDSNSTKTEMNFSLNLDPANEYISAYFIR